MFKLPVRTWILNAAVLCGQRGAVTRQAEQAGCSRQTIYQHAHKLRQRLAAEPPADPPTADRSRPGALAAPQPAAGPRILLDKDKLKELATTAFAMGLSLRQIEDLLGVLLLPMRSPTIRPWGTGSRPRPAAPGPSWRRWTRRVPTGSAPRPRRDLFWGRPTLVGIEPASMTAVFCRAAADRKAATWEGLLVRFPRLEFAVSDAAKGIAAAVAQRAAARRDDPSAPPLEHGLDVFHTAREAHRVLARHWRRAEAAWEKIEGAEAELAGAKRQGIDARGPARAAGAAWRRATAALEEAKRLESARGRAAGALEMFDADGRLNDRIRASAEIAAALKDLAGPEWSKVRHFLTDPRGLAFLDRMHRRLSAAEPRPDWREAMAWRWWLRHGRVGPSGPLTELLRGVARDGALDAEERASYERVAAVLGDTVRASSTVECMNSVLRMQQSRHRRMTQPMLDLKRLYWNCRPFRSGPRKDACPYRALGVELPTYDFWELLHADPARLTQQLSTQGNAD